MSNTISIIKKAHTQLLEHILVSLPVKFTIAMRVFIPCIAMADQRINLREAQLSGYVASRIKYVPIMNPKDRITIIALNHLQNDLFSWIKYLYCSLFLLVLLLAATT